MESETASRWPNRKQLAVIIPSMTLFVVLVALLASRVFTDFEGARENGWVGKQRWAIRIFQPTPDNRFTIDGFDESWSNSIWMDTWITTAVEYDHNGEVVSSDQFLINDDVPGNVVIEKYRPIDN